MKINSKNNELTYTNTPNHKSTSRKNLRTLPHETILKSEVLTLSISRTLPLKREVFCL